MPVLGMSANDPKQTLERLLNLSPQADQLSTYPHRTSAANRAEDFEGLFAKSARGGARFVKRLLRD